LAFVHLKRTPSHARPPLPPDSFITGRSENWEKDKDDFGPRKMEQEKENSGTVGLTMNHFRSSDK